MKVTFLGAAETVTGSMFLLESKGTKILIDCGMFQGLKNLRLKNWGDFDFNIHEIDAVILTHAHVDHSGRIPLLVKRGFHKKIFCTAATADLAEILLKDAAMLQMEDAELANQKKYSKHKPARPLYDFEDVQNSLPLFTRYNFNQEFTIGDLKVKFLSAGHILGAAQVLIESHGKSILFSGDIGRINDPLMKSPDHAAPCDVIVMESTYGGQLHDKSDPIEKMASIVRDIIKNRGVLMIPSFAVARAQLILHTIFKVFEKYPELKIPVTLNSPMATNVSKLYLKYIDEHKLTREQIAEVFSTAKYIEFPKQSVKLNESEGPQIVIAGSGMLTGGRILHHLWAWGKDDRNIILLVGYQAEGTRGYDLENGITKLKLHGNFLDVKARVMKLETFSAHADQEELLDWLSQARSVKKVVLVHGEKESSATLSFKIQERFKLPVEVALMNQTIEW